MSVRGILFFCTTVAVLGTVTSLPIAAQDTTKKTDDAIKKGQKALGAFQNSDKTIVKSIKVADNIYAVDNFCIIANGKFKESLSDVEKVPGLSNILQWVRLFTLQKGDAYCRINFAKQESPRADNLYSPHPAPSYSLKAFATKKEIDKRTGNCFAVATCKPNALKAGPTVDGFSACFDLSRAVGSKRAVVLGVGSGLPDEVKALVGKAHDKSCQDLKL